MMKTQSLQRMLIGLVLAMTLVAPWASASTNYYVVAPGQSTPTPPWTNWGWAHTNLIEVVAAARDNDTVYVTNNATYWLTNQIAVTYAITVRSWGPGGILDPTNTILSGRYPGATNRHFQLNNAGAAVAGFTLKKGCEIYGGSIWLQNGMVTNCTIVSNFAYTSLEVQGNDKRGGGGVHMEGSSGGVWNCVFSGNTATNSGAGICIKSGGPWRIASCRISGGNALISGGGIYAGPGGAGAIISNCWVVSNYSPWYAGGIHLANCAECHNSFIMGNSVDLYEGGGIRMSAGALVRNCLIVNNITQKSHGGGVDARVNASIQNCTIASNEATLKEGGGINLDGSYSAQLENTIIWGNSGSGTASNWYIYPTGSGTNTFTNCCTAPDIAGVGAYTATEVNTITNDPRFVNNATDFRLQPDSPCINAGVNRAWMDGAQDLDGYRRIDNFRKTVDIGAYEHLGRGTVFKIH
ncbi:MAG: right-handed parallel beta-helix repeat-containing protein [Kiritimatiellaeota bacterium]|nr:right-handed parallel beta-helix repeat-containing protein [Kiritimatiellota bacterium]